MSVQQAPEDKKAARIAESGEKVWDIIFNSGHYFHHPTPPPPSRYRIQSSYELSLIGSATNAIKSDLEAHVLAAKIASLTNFARHISAFNNEVAVSILKRGVSSRVMEPLSIHLDLGKGELAALIDLDRTTAKRRADSDKLLPLHSAENVLRLLELENIANDTFESPQDALMWLRRPHPMLEGDSPLEAAKTSFGTQRVKDILIAIKYGGVV